MKAFHAYRRPAGLTLIELMVAVGVLGIAALIAVPNVQQLINNNRVAAQSNELVSLLHLARNQAIRLNALVELRLAANGNAWTGRVFIDECTVVVEGNEVSCAAAEGCPQVDGFIRCLTASGLNLNGGAYSQTLTFNNRGYLGAGSENWEANMAVLRLRHPQCRGALQHREISVLPTGQIEVQALDCDPDP